MAPLPSPLTHQRAAPHPATAPPSPTGTRNPVPEADLAVVTSLSHLLQPMALQFFSVHSEALAFTHDCLRRHAHHHGLRPPGPTRALRVAQLYGHLQWRAANRRSFSLPLSELAASWRLQPRQLRQDLALLQSLGWLSAHGTTRGTDITLHTPGAPGALSAGERPQGEGSGSAGAAKVAAGSAPEPAAAGAPEPEPEPASRTTRRTGKAPKASAGPRHRDSHGTPGGTVAAADRALLEQLTGLYNQHRPPSWPPYQPRGTALLPRIRQALRQAGGPQALADALRAALQAMPPFWRTTYPQNRSGAQCFAALFQADRSCAALGVEFWHLFHWSQGSAAAPLQPGGGVEGPGNGVGQTGEELESKGLQRARRLFAWDAGIWRGQGREALHISRAEKRELTRLLEAHGLGIPGTADRQFAEPPDAATAATPAAPALVPPSGPEKPAALPHGPPTKGMGFRATGSPSPVARSGRAARRPQALPRPPTALSGANPIPSPRPAA